jgi:sugar lactone lactonase YvrE
VGEAKGEGYFKRPTGLAINKKEGLLYITDTLRDRIYVADLQGSVLRYFGERGAGTGQFNFPTEVVLHGEELLVVDAMNFRVQIFDQKGTFRGQFGRVGDSVGTLFRPKGLSFDSEGNIYLVDASLETVQVFNREGRLLYAFGRTGSEPGQFVLPSGLFIDARDRIFVADSYNRRIQEFKFTPRAGSAGAQ